MREGRYVEIRCSARGGKCQGLIGRIVADENHGIVLKDGKSSFQVPTEWYFVRGCQKKDHSVRGRTPETVAHRDLVTDSMGRNQFGL